MVKDSQERGERETIMTIHAIQESVLPEEENENADQPLPPLSNTTQRRNKTKKRANGNVVLRRKHSVPSIGSLPFQLWSFREESKRSSSIKCHSTGYLYDDVKIPSDDVVMLDKPNRLSARRGSASLEQPKRKPKKARGLRRTLSMPSFQKQIKGNSYYSRLSIIRTSKILETSITRTDFTVPVSFPP